MKVTGKLSREGNDWVVRDQTGRRYTLRGVSPKKGMEGLTVQITATVVDEFGGDFFGTGTTVQVSNLLVV